MAEEWALPEINSSMGNTPEETLSYCNSGRVDWSGWAMRDMRQWLRDVRAYEQRVIDAMRSLKARDTQDDAG